MNRLDLPPHLRDTPCGIASHEWRGDDAIITRWSGWTPDDWYLMSRTDIRTVHDKYTDLWREVQALRAEVSVTRLTADDKDALLIAQQQRLHLTKQAIRELHDTAAWLHNLALDELGDDPMIAADLDNAARRYRNTIKEVEKIG